MAGVPGASGGPHLLLQGAEAVLRAPPRGDHQATLLSLRRGIQLTPSGQNLN